MPVTATDRNCPLRSKSANTIAEVFCGALSSPLKATTAMGNWVMPTPDTSTLNWAQVDIGMNKHRVLNSQHKRLKEVKKFMESIMRIGKV
jgi:hypothetical protein